MKKLLIYLEGEDYFKKVLGEIKKSKTKVCYVSLNKSNEFLKETFTKNNIDKNKIYIIDVITKVITKAKRAKRGVNFVSNAYRLDEISNLIKDAIKKGHRLIILDSLSNLLNYYSAFDSEKRILAEFLNSFLNDSKNNIDLIFISKKEDEENELIQQILHYFDIYETGSTFFGVMVDKFSNWYKDIRK